MWRNDVRRVWRDQCVCKSVCVNKVLGEWLGYQNLGVPEQVTCPLWTSETSSGVGPVWLQAAPVCTASVGEEREVPLVQTTAATVSPGPRNSVMQALLPMGKLSYG